MSLSCSFFLKGGCKNKRGIASHEIYSIMIIVGNEMEEEDMKKRFFSAGLLTTLLLMGCSSTPVLKSGEIEIPVHKVTGFV